MGPCVSREKEAPKLVLVPRMCLRHSSTIASRLFVLASCAARPRSCVYVFWTEGRQPSLVDCILAGVGLIGFVARPARLRLQRFCSASFQARGARADDAQVPWTQFRWRRHMRRFLRVHILVGGVLLNKCVRNSESLLPVSKTGSTTGVKTGHFLFPMWTGSPPGPTQASLWCRRGRASERRTVSRTRPKCRGIFRRSSAITSSIQQPHGGTAAVVDF